MAFREKLEQNTSASFIQKESDCALSLNPTQLEIE
jgi:hypothetical protein